MRGNTVERWPLFSLVSIDVPDNPRAEAVRSLLEPGVPADFMNGRYVAMESVQFFDDLAAFGATTSSKLCLELPTERVVEVMNADPSGLRLHVNANLACFVRCVKVVIGAFPFYTWESDDVDWDVYDQQVSESCDLVRRLLAAEDPTSLFESDSFWDDVVYSMEIGDMETGMVLEEESE